MNKKISLGLAISLAAIAAALSFILTSAFSLKSFNEKITEVANMAETYKRLDDVDTYVREHYYTDINEEDVMNGLLKGYVSGLNDKYARYSTPEEFQELLREDEGLINGIGISVIKEESGYMCITEIAEDSPAGKTALQVGDIIVAVDGENVLTLGYGEAVKKVRGTTGTEVKLTIRRDGVDQDITMMRQELVVKTVSSEMLSGNIGYIRVTAFRSNTVEQFQTALDSLVQDGATGLIFDMRDNHGGLVSSVSGCLDPLLPAGDVAYALYKDGTTESIITSDEAELDLPMAVLVNQNSASAAEIFPSALRDFGKAKLYGTTTFGKGIMQDTIALDDGGGLTITVARYRTAKSECYHGIGLTPDVQVDLPEDAPALDALQHAEDTQLQAALTDLLMPAEE